MPSRIPSHAILSVRGDASQICRKCATSLRRRYASAATAALTPDSADLTTSEHSSPREAYTIHASVILSRPPQITADQHAFEKAFFLYQRRLNERLALPFTRYFYYSKGTPKFIDFQKKIKARKTPARDIGLYEAYGKNKWNDEVILGAPEGEPEHQMDALLKDERPFEETGKPGEAPKDEEQLEETRLYTRPLPRITEADKAGDEKSLNRLLQRTLYLMIQDKDGQWRFPAASLNVGERESLRSASERALTQSAGVNMNTWILGNHPVGHLEQTLPAQQHKTNQQGNLHVGDLTFFMRGHIMAGQADIKDNTAEVRDFKWLAKDEIAKLVAQKYWTSIATILPER